jgi:photosystem II stability/assembly factor-like uncharacterized protein
MTDSCRIGSTLLMVLCSIDSSSQWVLQESGYEGPLQRVDFVDSSHGWISYRDTVSHTPNGGADWLPQGVNIPTVFALTTVDFISRERGWAGGTDTAGNAIIIRTTNGGGHWSEVSPGVGTFINDLFFLNEDCGWAFGQNGSAEGMILRTTDSGDSWNVQDDPAGGFLLSGFFVDSSTGWAVGNAVILKTSDGGNVWVEQDTEYTHSLDAVPLRSAYFVNRDTGWVVGGIQWVSVIAKTTDGGSTWTNDVFEPPNPHLDIGRLNWVHFVNDTTGWCVGRVYPYVPELIIKTTDGGNSWQRQDQGLGEQLYCVQFTDESHGWAVGQAGTILATTNGGVSFVGSQVEHPSEITLFHAYPNPFNGSTTIRYTLPNRSRVRLEIFSILGESVTILRDEEQDAGHYAAVFDVAGLPSGVYFYRLSVSPSATRDLIPSKRDGQAGNAVRTGKVILAR